MLYNWWQQVHFAYPWLLGLIPLFALIAAWYIGSSRGKQMPTMRFTIWSGLPISNRQRCIALPEWLWALGLVLLMVAMSRPQYYFAEKQVKGKGIDMVLCMDVSGSMLAQDLQPNRLQAAKAVAAQFVGRREGDRIGLVIFSGEPFTQCALTTDHSTLLQQLQAVKSGWLADGTAIGAGLALAVRRLATSTSPSKVIILLTDGVENGGLVDPITARKLAADGNIRVYTVGLGTIGTAPIPKEQPDGQVKLVQEPVRIDEELLKAISAATGGQYFRAQDNAGLQTVYSQIDQLEQSTASVTPKIRKQDAWQPWLLAASICWVLALGFRWLWLKKAIE